MESKVIQKRNWEPTRVLVFGSCYNINWRDVQIKNVVNNADISSLRAPWHSKAMTVWNNIIFHALTTLTQYIRWIKNFLNYFLSKCPAKPETHQLDVNTHTFVRLHLHLNSYKPMYIQKHVYLKNRIMFFNEYFLNKKIIIWFLKFRKWF